MKVLINKCYGGFGYSESFIKHLKAINIPTIFDHYQADRSDKLIVEEAIKFGLNSASSLFARLTVVEIPDGAEFSISEYDGMEHIDQIWITVTIDELKKGLSEEQLKMVSQGCDIKISANPSKESFIN